MNITIPKGKHYDFSIARILHRFLPFRYRVDRVIVFEAEILTPPYDIRPDADQSDRHKLFGINLNCFKPSNHNAIMLSFQANPETNTWDLSIYMNDNKAWTDRPEFPSKVGDKIRGEFKLTSRNSIEVTVYLNGEKVIQTPFKYIWLNNTINFPALILPWHGGKDNDENGIGGVSPVDLRINLKIKK